MSYWETVRPTYIENWPAELCNLSLAQVDVPLTVTEAKRLGANIIDMAEMFAEYAPPGCDIDDIRQRVSNAVAKFPRGSFVRLGSRSPKDSWLGNSHGFRVEDIANACPLRFLTDASERIAEDLLLAIQHDYAPHIFVRQWHEIPRWAEFRCFMRGRRLIGVSQYQYLDGPLPEIIAEPEYFDWAIEQFFPDFRTACHLDDVIFDVWVKPRRRGNHRVTEVKLIEINPFCELTDPCLFDWRDGGVFDGSFRYCEPQTAKTTG